MAYHLFDTSALVKNYHPEVGSTRVSTLLALPGSQHALSRLTLVEMHSVLATKVRNSAITEAEMLVFRRRFLHDVTQRRFKVIRMVGAHFHEAERLIRGHSNERGLRTLDAIQLAVAMGLQKAKQLDHFVCADRILCVIAALEGVPLINPEQP
jgi:predicted nucleic acid-binding protein